MGRYDSDSPDDIGSSRRRSPAGRGSSPGRHRNSKVDKVSSRNFSPKQASSRSHGYDLPVRRKSSDHTKLSKYRKSPSSESVSPVSKSKSSQYRSTKHAKSRSQSPVSPLKGGRKPKIAEVERDSAHGREYDKNQRDGKRRERSVHDERKNLQRLPSESSDRGADRAVAGNGSRSEHGRAASPYKHNQKGRKRSRSPLTDDRGRDELENPRDEDQRDGVSDSLSKMKAAEADLEAKEKQKPSFELSGKLAAETNRVRGVTLLFNEPPDARKPNVRWRLYVFKGGEVLNDPLYLHRQSCYLFGRERRIADIPTDHPSCSKQHAVLQYRQVEVENEDGMMSRKVRPYLMDLGSTNGTFINDNKLEPQRYYELMEKDTVKFGNSSREYVLLHENSAT